MAPELEIPAEGLGSFLKQQNPEPFIMLDYHVTEPTGLAGEVILHMEAAH